MDHPQLLLARSASRSGRTTSANQAVRLLRESAASHVAGSPREAAARLSLARDEGGRHDHSTTRVAPELPDLQDFGPRYGRGCTSTD